MADAVYSMKTAPQEVKIIKIKASHKSVHGVVEEEDDDNMSVASGTCTLIR